MALKGEDNEDERTKRKEIRNARHVERSNFEDTYCFAGLKIELKLLQRGMLHSCCLSFIFDTNDSVGFAVQGRSNEFIKEVGEWRNTSVTTSM